jgi:excisionase family DNA binding protein
MIRKNCHLGPGGASGAARRGAALLAGLIRRRRCGMKLSVHYTGGGAGGVPRYVCHRGYDGSGKARCIGFGGTSVDAAVVREVMRVIPPGAVEAALVAARKVLEQHDQAIQALGLEMEAARYEANRARRQYDAADPENRLVAAELERRWNLAMEKVQQIERRMEQERTRRGVQVVPTVEGLRELAEDVAGVWDDPRTDIRLKKQILRTLIEEVVADVDSVSSEVRLVVHWKGGVHTELAVPRRRPGQRRCNTPADVIEAVKSLARICPDDRIAAWRTRNGLKTSAGNCWTRQHVTGLRHRHGIDVYSAERQHAAGWMNLTEAASYLGIDRATLRVAIDRGQIQAVRPLSIGPWLLRREDLDCPQAQAVSSRVQDRNKTPGRDIPGQLTLDLASTS